MKDDGFILQNLFRLLRITCNNAVCITLLNDPRWITKQMKAVGWKQVDTEFKEILEEFETDTNSAHEVENEEDDNIQTFLLMVWAAISETERYVVVSDEPGMINATVRSAISL